MAVGLNVNADNIGSDTRGELDGLSRDTAPILDGNDSDRRCGVLWSYRVQRLCAHAHGVIVAANGSEKEYQEGDKEESDPGTFGKFGDEHDASSNAGHECAKTVDEGTFSPMVASFS